MTLSPHVTQQYTLGPVKPWVEQAAYFLGPMFGIKTIGGWRQSDPISQDHPSGHALDYMVPDKATGDALANYSVAHYQELGIKYIVWNRQIWTPQKGWHEYTVSPGKPYNPHTDHVHETYNDTPGTGTAALTGTPIALTADDTCAWKISGELPVIGGPNVCLLTKKQVRAQTGGMLMVGGTAVILIGVALLVVMGLGRQLPSIPTRLLSRIIPAPPIRHQTERHIYHHNVPDDGTEE